MENKKAKNVLLVIMGVLIVAQIVGVIDSLINYHDVLGVFKLISLAFIALYGFVLYKKPHGNMLKYAMLLLAVSQIILSLRIIKIGWDESYFYTVRVFAAVILVYVAGRLNRIEQNKYLLPLVFIAQFVSSILTINTYNNSQYTLVHLFSWFSGAISTLTLMIAYFVRYREHKLAGIMDMPKN